jgi:hypothetical protein
MPAAGDIFLITAIGLMIMIAGWRSGVVEKEREMNPNTADVALYAVTLVLG